MMTINYFRFVSVIEGLSLLLLYFFAMPMKYYFHEPIYVKYIGMVHGVLFILYVLFSSALLLLHKINIKRFIIFNFLSLIPFGFYILESRYLQNKNY